MRLALSILLLLAGVMAGPARATSDPHLIADYWSSVWSQSFRIGFNDALEVGAASSDPLYSWRYSTRIALQSKSDEYVAKLAQSGGFIQAPDLEDYVQRVLLNVFPGQMPEGHPGAIRARVIASSTPNACALADGTILINTGLLTLLQNEDELAAVLAHEVGHVMLDHNVSNYDNARAREGFANFLGVVAGVAAGVAAARSNDPVMNYYAGQMAVSAFVLGASLSSEILSLFGAKFSRDQEKAADQAAQQYLVKAQRDPAALARVLRRLQRWGEVHGQRTESSLADDHPSIPKRLKLLPTLVSPTGVQDPGYDASIVVALDRTARIQLAQGRYLETSTTCERISNTGWQDGEMLVVRATAARLGSSDSTSVRKAQGWVDLAEQRYGYNGAGLYLERALLCMREHDEPGALVALTKADAKLKEEGFDQDSDIVSWVHRSISRLRGRAH